MDRTRRVNKTVQMNYRPAAPDFNDGSVTSRKPSYAENEIEDHKLPPISDQRRVSYRSTLNDDDLGNYSINELNERYEDIDDYGNVTNARFMDNSSKRSNSLKSENNDDDEENEDDADTIMGDDNEGEMLDQSSAELKATIDELEKRYDTIENEGNEWKTRYETQTEMNQQLEKQLLLLQEKVEEAKRNLKEANKSPRDNRAFDDLADASAQMVKSLEREKNSLHNQLRDLEWRLDQESKAYHKANDERKQYVLEINATKGNIGEMKAKQRQMMLTAQESPRRITPRSNDSPRSNRDMGGNIPEDQRILDARYGPIRKTAGVKALPSIDNM